jgi:hypothetical protein
VVEPEPIVEVSQAEGTRVGSAAGDFGLGATTGGTASTSRSPPPATASSGRTTVTASLSVLDPIDFDPVDSDTDTVTVWVHAAADVLIGRHAEISAGGTLQLPVLVRCQRPWVVQELAVDVTQTQNGGSNAGEFGIVCDGEWHRIVVPVDPVVGPWFPGPADVNAFFTVLNPESFDPVDQAQDSADDPARRQRRRRSCTTRPATRLARDHLLRPAGRRRLDAQGADDFK